MSAAAPRSPTAGPLAGIRVLDFSNLLPGPLASLLLVEAGAEVIKIERPGIGDEMRGYPPAWAGASGNFALLNRGKSGLCADLKSDDDRTHVRELARSADVLIEQFRPGVMARLGLDYEALRADNPGLVYCSITGYGQIGERALKAGHDLNYVAETGLLGLTRGVDAAPVLPQVLAGDIGAGAYPAVINILLALHDRARTGRGCHIDVAMCDNLFTFAYWGMSSGLAGGRWPRPGGELTTGGSPRYRIYRTADDEYLAVAPIEERFWQIFCDRIGLDDADRDDRVDPALTSRKVAERIATQTAAQWRERFAGADACVSVVESLQNVFADPAFARRGLFKRIVSARGFEMPALPIPVVDGLRDPSAKRPFPELDAMNRRKPWSNVRVPAPRPYDLAGMRILLTEAGGSVGQATARLCAGLGAELVLIDRMEPSGLIDALRTDGRDHRFLACDVGSPHEIERLVAIIGGIDAAVLKVATTPGGGPRAEERGSSFEWAIDSDAGALAGLTQTLIDALKACGGGRMILLGPVEAPRGSAGGALPAARSASRTTLSSIVRAFARRAPPQVLVNGVAHGEVGPSMMADPDGSAPDEAPRRACPEEIAWPIAFLCSPGARFVCGTVLDVDGGACLR